MSTLLTGATGFLGNNLLRRLLDDGNQVRVLVRNPKALGVESDKLTIIQGDLRDAEAVEKAVDGAKRIFHVAAVVKEWVKDWSIFQRVNVDAWETLLKTAQRAGVQRIVHTSSFFALGQTDAATVADESLRHEPDHFHNPYEQTKYLASKITADYVGSGVPVISVIPGFIFGPGAMTEGNMIAKTLQDMGRGKFPGIPGDGEKQWTYSFAGDVVNGHILAMEKGSVGQSYILGGENHTLNEFVEVAQKHLGRKIPKRHLPLGLLKFSAFFLEKIANATGKPPMLTRNTVATLRHNWAYSSQKAIDELGYTITPFDEAILKTVTWLRESGHLPS
jgi:NAD+-dependent farnesol dehydrogenase